MLTEKMCYNHEFARNKDALQRPRNQQPLTIQLNLRVCPERNPTDGTECGQCGGADFELGTAEKFVAAWLQAKMVLCKNFAEPTKTPMS